MESNRKKIELNEENTVGIDIIDNQHEQLFERMNLVMEAIDDDEVETMVDSINFLLEYTIFHFKTEENMMMHYLATGFHEHRDDHSFFVKKVFSMKLVLEEEGCTDELLAFFQQEMIPWLNEHIKEKDKQLIDIEAN